MFGARGFMLAGQKSCLEKNKNQLLYQRIRYLLAVAGIGISGTCRQAAARDDPVPGVRRSNGVQHDAGSVRPVTNSVPKAAASRRQADRDILPGVRHGRDPEPHLRWPGVAGRRRPDGLGAQDADRRRTGGRPGRRRHVVRSAEVAISAVRL